jgi:hypothetical protein
MLYVENKAKLFESHTKAELSAFSPHKYKNTLSGAFVFCGGGEIRTHGSLQLQYTFSRFSYHNAQNRHNTQFEGPENADFRSFSYL